MFRFEQPEWLWLLAAPMGVWLVRRWQRRRALAWLDPALAPWVLIDTGGGGGSIRLALLAAVWMLVVVALAQPQWGRPAAAASPEEASGGGTVVLLMDLSRSMRVRDVSPDRLTAARIIAGGLLLSLPAGDRIGLRVFDGSSHWVTPPTTDRALLQADLRLLEADTLPLRGSRVALALAETVAALAAIDRLPATIILLTDGQAPADASTLSVPAVSPDRRQQIRLLTVGIGTPAGGPIPAGEDGGVVRWRGAVVTAPLYEAMLRRLTQQWQGHYWRYTSAEEQIRTLRNALMSEQDVRESAGRHRPIQWRSVAAVPLAVAVVVLWLAFWPTGEIGRRWRG